MNDFLNNFSSEKYEKQVVENEPTASSNEKSKAPEGEQPTEPPKRSKTMKLQGAAFEDEKVSIDSSYNEFLFKRTLTICLTILGVVMVVAGVYLYLNQTVAINLVDKTQTEAEKWLVDKDVNYDITTVESDSKVSGTVLSQTIPQGEKIGVLDLQTIEVSSGPDMKKVVSLDEIKGKTEEEIQKFIDSKLLTNVSIVTEYSSKVKAGKYIRIDFDDDSVTSKNYTREDKAQIIVSKGDKKQKKNLKVDNFVNQTIDKVSEWNKDSEVMIDTTDVPSDIPTGYIVSQSIEPGTMVGYGDILKVEVSKGPGVETPNLVGMKIDSATEAAEEQKITVEPKEIYSDSAVGYVVGQSKAAGSSIYPEEDTLKLEVSLGKPFLSDMSGSTVGDAVAAINELNSQGANLTYTIEYFTLSKADKAEGKTSGTLKSHSYRNSFASPGTNIKLRVYS